MSDPVDTYTEVTRRSWGDKIAGSLIGLVLGPLLVIGACIALFWNEGRAVQTARSLTEGASVVVDVAASPVSLANQGLLVHVTGEMKASTKLSDPDFGLTADAIRLIRDVAMYQWKEDSKSETRKNAGGSEETVTTYTYKREWSGRPIDSSKFKEPGLHENPPMTIRDRDVISRDATLGAFRLGEAAIRRFNTDTRLEVEPSIAGAVQEKLNRPADIQVGQIYLSDDPGSPRIGDYRVGYRIVPVGIGSVVARQTGTELTGYPTKAGDVILLAHTGSQSAADMFKAAQDENRVLTWILRAVFTMLVFIGFVFSTRILVALADVLPFVGNLMQATTFAAALALTAIIAPLTIAIAWLFYRPLISLGVAAGGAALAYGVLRLIAARKAMAPAGAPGPGPVRQ
ncbi:MAG: TMEM43 family protein [Pseudorhodoplanes sp.]|uniref:TMEM43 family protein n=1 Tax=Pseudorhodoplanes sp. TaxID=1934341 RepID=UPI003D0EE357